MTSIYFFRLAPYAVYAWKNQGFLFKSGKKSSAAGEKPQPQNKKAPAFTDAFG
ncbi:MAG TPA: hypothetical protein IAD19_01265 [Candidatus Egerieicola faecale]|uniref:Uncharacterized protein n=1 Tax=Candidatus Egerieicola faecale TaxID=2840774 RepID=A0A9D1IPZ7_9FIRM|nr:hypothetical protein [Candidatus Egerieicola faecale]